MATAKMLRERGHCFHVKLFKLEWIPTWSALYHWVYMFDDKVQLGAGRRLTDGEIPGLTSFFKTTLTISQLWFRNSSSILIILPYSIFWIVICKFTAEKKLSYVQKQQRKQVSSPHCSGKLKPQQPCGYLQAGRTSLLICHRQVRVWTGSWTRTPERTKTVSIWKKKSDNYQNITQHFHA